MKFILALVLGIFSVSLLPDLPALAMLLAISGALALVAWLLPAKHRLFPLLVLSSLIGALYGVVKGESMLARQLPVAQHGQDFFVTGTVLGLPEGNSKRVRFYFVVREIESLEDSVDPMVTLPARLYLSWYHSGQKQPPPDLRPGQVWRLKVRLRRPRGTLNPGGFDYQLWLLRRGFSATGYVRAGNENRLLLATDAGRWQVVLDQTRYRVRERIGNLPLDQPARALLTALTIGEKGRISPASWQDYSALGVAHLLVISGLHIGLASLCAYWLVSFIARVAAIYRQAITVRYWGTGAAILVAAAYALLAGWTIPTQRAFIMVAVASGLVLLNRSGQKAMGFVLALAAVALFDPLAVWAAGFWLSFAAVAILLWLLPAPANRPGLISLITRVITVQLVVSVGLVPVLLSLGLPFSPLMPLVNFIAIPWISFLVVPLCLSGALLLPLAPGFADQVLTLAGCQLQFFDRLAAVFGDMGLTYDRGLLAPGPLPLAALVTGALLILLPRGLAPKLPGLALLLVAVLHRPENAPLAVTVLDVGQGLAVVVTTGKHALVYDAGPLYSERFNAGTGIVLPYLRWRGIRAIDALVVSHGDNDHAGGATPLAEAITPGRLIADPVLVSGAETGSIWVGGEPCRKDLSWQWDGVDFRVLSPGMPVPGSDNNRSCVVSIRHGDIGILLPGDIEREIESVLVRENLKLGKLALLVAPHHGSGTSSSRPFIDLLQPQNVVFSSGFRHHFGHPHPSVVNRYRGAGARLFNTADSGALQFTWDRDGELRVSRERERVRRFWHW